MRPRRLLAVAVLAGGSGLLLGLAGERITLQQLAGGLAVGFAALTGAAKQASP
jgi:hypothetical protein